MKIIQWVFRTFRDNLLHCNHSCTLFKSSFSRWHNISISLPVMNVLVSSANNTEKQNSKTLVKSLIYNKNNMGPNIDPCGTPQWFFFMGWLMIIISYVLHSIWQIIFSSIPHIPYLSIFCNKILWSTVSKALEKSKNTPTTLSPWSKASIILYTNIIIAK